MSPNLIDSVRTNVDAATPAYRGAIREVSNRHAWQQLIDYQLIEWGWDTEQFDDEGVEPPTPDTVQLAISLAEKLRDEDLAAPSIVMPDANGGIVFELRETEVTEVFRIWEDGTVEYQCFHGTRLIGRRPL